MNEETTGRYYEDVIRETLNNLGSLKEGPPSRVVIFGASSEDRSRYAELFEKMRVDFNSSLLNRNARLPEVQRFRPVNDIEVIIVEEAPLGDGFYGINLRHFKERGYTFRDKVSGNGKPSRVNGLKYPYYFDDTRCSCGETFPRNLDEVMS